MARNYLARFAGLKPKGRDSVLIVLVFVLNVLALYFLALRREGSIDCPRYARTYVYMYVCLSRQQTTLQDDSTF